MVILYSLARKPARFSIGRPIQPASFPKLSDSSGGTALARSPGLVISQALPEREARPFTAFVDFNVAGSGRNCLTPAIRTELLMVVARAWLGRRILWQAFPLRAPGHTPAYDITEYNAESWLDCYA